MSKSISAAIQQSAIIDALAKMKQMQSISCKKAETRKDIQSALDAFEVFGYTANVVTHCFNIGEEKHEVVANVLGFDLKTVSDAYSLRYSEGENPIQDFIKAKHIDRIEFLEDGEIVNVLIFNYKVEQDYKSGDIFLYFDLHGEKCRRKYVRGEDFSTEIFEGGKWRGTNKYDFDFEIELYNDEICVELYSMFLAEKELNERMRDY